MADINNNSFDSSDIAETLPELDIDEMPIYQINDQLIHSTNNFRENNFKSGSRRNGLIHLE
jgi:hypothetical protein